MNPQPVPPWLDKLEASPDIFLNLLLHLYSGSLNLLRAEIPRLKETVHVNLKVHISDEVQCLLLNALKGATHLGSKHFALIFLSSENQSD